jgi:dCTP deaminase
MIEPFSEAVQDRSIISYGLTHAGYDLRLGGHVRIYKDSFGEVIDPLRFAADPVYWSRVFDEITNIPDGEAVLVPARGYILGYSKEYLRIPNNVKGRCVGKSTLARSGVGINTTPLEPGWEGHLTLEIANHSCCPVKVYVGYGICQLEFEMLGQVPETTYADKKGKYQNQDAQPVPPRVKQ